MDNYEEESKKIEDDYQGVECDWCEHICCGAHVIFWGHSLRRVCLKTKPTEGRF